MRKGKDMKQDILSIIKALSDMNRLRVFIALGGRDELCACQIIKMLKISGASVSRHLKVLNEASLIRNRKVGRWIFFRLNRDNALSVSFLDFLQSQVKGMTVFTQDQEFLLSSQAQEVITTCCRVRSKNE